MILPHIEKYSNDIFEKIKTIYNDIFDAIEVNASYDISKIDDKLKELSCIILRNSDAHQITDISEPIHIIELEELTIDCLFNKLKVKK